MSLYNDLASNARWIHESTATIKIKLIKGHTDTINSVQFIFDDTRLFTVSNDNTARIWDCQSGEELQAFHCLHTGSIPRGMVNKENSQFVTCSWDSTVKYWDLETGEKLWENSHEFMVTYCDISSDDKLVVSVSDVDYIIKLWCVLTGKIEQTIHGVHNNTITSCKFTPGCDRIITTSMDKSTKIYDLISKTNTLKLSGHTGMISNSFISNDERYLATCSWDKSINIWDVSTGSYRLNGEFKLTNGHEGSVSNVKISADNSIIATVGYDRRLVIWDMNIPKPKIILKSHSGWIHDLDISKNGKWVVTAGKDEDILMWDITDSDNVRLVVEQKEKMNIINLKCCNCHKPFIYQKMKKIKKNDEEKILCVFCRIEEFQQMFPGFTIENLYRF